MDLRDYERVKFELAEILRTVPYEASQTGRLREVFSRLAEDRFNLVVVGRFSRGKTSLMNALLGMDRLPTGVVPLTSVITTVGYGSEERVSSTTGHEPVHGYKAGPDIRLHHRTGQPRQPARYLVGGTAASGRTPASRLPFRGHAGAWLLDRREHPDHGSLPA